MSLRRFRSPFPITSDVRMPSPRIKICGLTRRRDAEAAASLGASYLGTVLVPSSPRRVEPEAAERLVRGLGVPGVAVVADLPSRAVVEAARRAGSEVIQLHGQETPETVAEVRGAGPWKVWKALGVREPAELKKTVPPFLEVADGILLDGWHPDRRGGTGTSFAWEEAAPLLEELRGETELILAGGLVPGNVARAVALVRPDTVDVSSGVEIRPGVKDSALLRSFFHSVGAWHTEDASAGRTGG